MSHRAIELSGGSWSPDVCVFDLAPSGAGTPTGLPLGRPVLRSDLKDALAKDARPRLGDAEIAETFWFDPPAAVDGRPLRAALLCRDARGYFAFLREEDGWRRAEIVNLDYRRPGRSRFSTESAEGGVLEAVGFVLAKGALVVATLGLILLLQGLAGSSRHW